MNQEIHIPYNVPVTLALADPFADSGNFDFEAREGRFRTTDGRVLVLPESAAVALNTVSPQAGESIQITRVWSGRSHDREEWVLCLSVDAEKARAAAGEQVEPGQGKEGTGEPPTPINRPARSKAPASQPTLFDSRGTGTYGPVPSPVRFSTPMHIIRRRPPAGEVIPANVALREILEFIEADPGTKNWGAEPKKNLACTVLIAEYRAKRIGLWEREK